MRNVRRQQESTQQQSLKPCHIEIVSRAKSQSTVKKKSMKPNRHATNCVADGDPLGQRIKQAVGVI
ncbi:hypothetical protein T4E_10335 [Trichinella pseudospiralis]|uniref:Uncharacterized protein n=1 Tax=Trichinella pseudospiralis TaxID=6337 RepID=A0A0V0XQ88_TRIPS|nr:hypothetical protein T4E_10335 [Trichinella pseudospiralis]